jgi:hypothetical protein
MSMQGQVQCQHCGAPMKPHPDGRVYSCNFCGRQAQVGVGADQIAAGMALDLTNIDAFMGRLAHALQQALGGQVRVDSGGGTVHAIELMLEPDGFLVRRDSNGVVAQHKRIVRGIALKTRDLPLDEWVHHLAEALARHANVNAHAAWALDQLGLRR